MFKYINYLFQIDNVGTASINYVTKYSSYLDQLMSLVEQLTAMNEPTIKQVNVLVDLVQSLHNRTCTYIIQYILNDYSIF